LRHHIRAAVAAVSLCVLATAAEQEAFAFNGELLATLPAQGASDGAIEQFLDHLMRAESNGRDTAANPRSTALGAFQFIESTFIAVAREHFAREVAELSDQRLLELRTNREFSRRAAAVYCRENIAYLSEQGLRPTFGHLRLAYLLGAGGAAKVMKAPPQKLLADILSPAAIRANPFMKGMTAAGLSERAHRDLRTREAVAAATTEGDVKPPQPSVEQDAPRCKQRLASCRHWMVTRRRKLDAEQAAGPSKAGKTAATRKAQARKA